MDKVTDHEIHDQQGISKSSSSPVDPAASEAVIVTGSSEVEVVSGEDGDLKTKANALETSKVSAEERKVSVSEPERHTCVIDIKCNGGVLGNENCDGEKVCRICQLRSDQASDISDLIQLGCGCKDELAVAHLRCAEAWFKLKGNRCCEICGEDAKSITGVGENRFMEEWIDWGLAAISTNSSGRGGCWRGNPFCQLIMICLVIAFLLPWLFHFSMF